MTRRRQRRIRPKGLLTASVFCCAAFHFRFCDLFLAGSLLVLSPYPTPCPLGGLIPFISLLRPLSHNLVRNRAETSTASRTVDTLIHKPNAAPRLFPSHECRSQPLLRQFKYSTSEWIPYPTSLPSPYIASSPKSRARQGRARSNHTPPAEVALSLHYHPNMQRMPEY